MSNSSFNNFQKADKVYWHDRVTEKILLKYFPKRILPNHLTVLRFLLIPIVIWSIIDGDFIFSLLFFLLAAATDALDGSLARCRNQITEWGKVYDPLADKLLIGSIVFVLIYKHLAPWISFTIIIIEILIIANGWYRKVNRRTVQSNVWGKIKMMLQVAGVCLLQIAVITNSTVFLLPYITIILYAAIFFAIVSLFTYGL